VAITLSLRPPMIAGVANALAASANTITDPESIPGMTSGTTIRRSTVDRVARRVGRTPAQVLLRWCLQRDVLVIPKSIHQERIRENAQIFDFALSPQDMTALDALDRTNGTDRARERNVWRGGLRRLRAIMPTPRTS